ncbi:hypothetical protein OGM63_11400 [Plectonema radiosum NIES-515]|uniref:Uncharacterized protein n=1 Tax=Plectonema radiosum NIES-515 TaxID=2986073 RepID=A0ABT3AY97_9CYAN|nr:hypothetical protein [Plectonema radiosum]MCV3214108.1 hypothetical protein [Plectonema radiosum NIES-515]
MTLIILISDRTHILKWRSLNFSLKPNRHGDTYLNVGWLIAYKFYKNSCDRRKYHVLARNFALLLHFIYELCL